MQGIYSTGTLILFLEIALMIILIIGWIYGARRMDFNFHHKAVYLVVAVHLVSVLLWMIPLTRTILWWQIVHELIGGTAIVMGIVLVILFIVRKGMPLKLLKRTRPFMFLTIGLWLISFLFGIYWWSVAYLP